MRTQMDNTQHSDLEQTMSIMRNAQYGPMVVIKGIEGNSCIMGVYFHHLLVCVRENQFIKYTFRACNGNDYLDCINVVMQPLDDLITECAHAVFKDGFATMHVYAM